MSDIQMTKQEIAAFNILNSTVMNCETAHKDATEARGAYLELVGLKYHATFVPELGKFVGIGDGPADEIENGDPPKSTPEMRA